MRFGRILQCAAAGLAATVIFTGCSAENTTAESVAKMAGDGEAFATTVAGAAGIIANEGWGEEIDAQISAGMLTAGEVRDNDDWYNWLDYIQKYEDTWALVPVGRQVVQIVMGEEPIVDVEVSLCDDEGNVLETAFTNHEGKAYFFGERGEQVCLSGEYYFDLRLDESGVTVLDMWIAFGDNQAVFNMEKKLDLMLVFDTTGSMGDELRYLQEELAYVVETVVQNNPNVPVRTSVNFYRDAWDEYVVRPYPFSEDLDFTVNNLRQQTASGGGDYPEALDMALYNAIHEHEWEAHSVKLMFLILDAPPHHNEANVELMSTLVSDAAAMGIRIIPVASSGIDKATEVLLRSMAMRTGGTYTFLTDDSGIGGGHLAPEDKAYEVERLNELLIRIIGEYIGVA